MNDNNTHEGPSNRVPPLATGSASSGPRVRCLGKKRNYYLGRYRGHEIAVMARDAMKRGVAFAAQPIGGCNYKVMEIA